MTDPAPDPTGSFAFCCGHCDSDTPWWRILRSGDAVVSWACFAHLPEVCMDLQRPDEKTELTITEHQS
jgi:hypothetical protein